LISSLSTSLFVGWRPSFDGGEEQNFQLEYRKVNPAKGIPDSVEPVAIYIDGRNASYSTLYEEEETNHHSRQAFSSIAYVVYNISYLNPLSTYWFRVRARNLVGSSDWTPVTTATTSDVRECAAIPRPLTLYYNSAQQKIDFEAVISGIFMKLKNQKVLIKINSLFYSDNFRVLNHFCLIRFLRIVSKTESERTSQMKIFLLNIMCQEIICNINN
uniref:Fibronectin type-III domain-containing protein n=1 Tax=Brugia timori TaxID=42155 RepID=A0A0R3RD96_9BILA